MLLSELIAAAQSLARLPLAAADFANRPVSSLSDDTRQIGSETLFIVNEQSRAHLDSEAARDAAAWLCLAGDAHRAPANRALVVEDVALAAGALASALHGHPSQHLQLVGITGTNGKTTVTHMLLHIWRSLNRKAGIIGTLGAEWNGSRGLVCRSTGYTTPRAPESNALLAEMRADGVTHVAMEVSSEALALGRCMGLRFSAAGFSNLSPDHLDFHGDMERYFQAKLQLFALCLPHSAIAICAADEWCHRLRQDLVRQGHDVQWLASAYDGTLQAPALFNRWNAALALACAQLAPGEESAARQALANFSAAPGRLERIDDPGRKNCFVVIDYAHSPDALQKAMEAVRELGAEQLIVVFGCGGNRDRAKRPLMGALAARLADSVIVCDDNPRYEEPAAIRRNILEGIAQLAATEVRARVQEIGDRRQAIEAGIALLRTSSAVQTGLLIAGKGHEQFQIVGDERRHFSDREIALEILAQP
ncbi:MAG: UDP-N-acetylmuramoyl-L-alanyl-D-glutamate--2,6-diaminopimelate ligase [Leptospirales bacterium]|nr:UDP-N-acetylmuramoyl-L-alanyl-D-glutamate--2,6-diaminopimelate ligase [Leptospirales bacterium]